ncbi:dimethylhistidine N-methyltransferase [Pseudoduganella flava]|uniref:Dimethylhistidine N-methyltransferase n=1 Tax=Pseudoduganella flava TaxID=871742 RepID=A0A562PEI6_9BURK|nr:L-histidine N(alpha)-methyltransferase [Pseudoduganella flava]QGZ42206.1 L-histidine N(alpha)-methyltransferase [Pseudoduganella flava]TWI42406.1 dimethylhistidine N-methyltransferase [Pseudoduganella flava]
MPPTRTLRGTSALRVVPAEVSDAQHCQPAGDAATIAEITAGLLAPHAATSPKYLYDSLGSRLFEAICELPEYYPTRTEAAIFARYGADIARHVGQGSTLVDLGAGNCAKAASLFPLLEPKHYVPIDISRDFLNEAVSRLRQRFPRIEMTPLALDLSKPFALPASVDARRRVFFYPGSSIGNFAPHEAIAFLRRIRENTSADGGLLIGVDLIKDAAVLDAAYDDAIGVTAAFNLNMLRHLNHLAGADFDVRQWRHVAFFNAEESRIEMHLEARTALTVRWCGGERHFERGERIHTEDSYKYTPASFTDVLAQAGFTTDTVWTDDAHWFAVIHARAAAA